MAQKPTFPVDFDAIRVALVRELQRVCMVTAITAEPEVQNAPRPPKPYFTMKITNPAQKYGDDSKQNLRDDSGQKTNIWNSGGNRKMTVAFECYGNSHEEAYNYAGLWQTALDTEPVQENLRKAGIAVWIIGTVVDLSQLLNTGYEGRSLLEVNFGIAMNLQSDLGAMESVTVDGNINTDRTIAHISVTIPEAE